MAPTGIDAVADADGNGMVVRWTDQSDGLYNFMVRATLLDGSLSLPVTAERGAAAVKLEVDPNQVKCITVSALISLEPSVFAPSEAFCL